MMVEWSFPMLIVLRPGDEPRHRHRFKIPLWSFYREVHLTVFL